MVVSVSSRSKFGFKIGDQRQRKLWSKVGHLQDQTPNPQPPWLHHSLTNKCSRHHPLSNHLRHQTRMRTHHSNTFLQTDSKWKQSNPSIITWWCLPRRLPARNRKTSGQIICQGCRNHTIIMRHSPTCPWRRCHRRHPWWRRECRCLIIIVRGTHNQWPTSRVV